MTLPPAPEDLPTTRDALHRVAEQVISARRVQDTGNEIALTVRDGAVATPDLPGGGWVGMCDGDLLCADAGGAVARSPLTTLRAAARDAGLDARENLDDAPLPVDPGCARFLTVAFSFAAAAISVLHGEAEPDTSPSPVRLWPEHFDIAYEQGDEADGLRAGYGFSPGDELHPQPYAYVVPWTARPAGALWQATGFAGAQLDWDLLVAEPDPQAAVLDFWRARRAEFTRPS